MKTPQILVLAAAFVLFTNIISRIPFPDGWFGEFLSMFVIWAVVSTGFVIHAALDKRKVMVESLKDDQRNDGSSCEEHRNGLTE